MLTGERTFYFGIIVTCIAIILFQQMCAGKKSVDVEAPEKVKIDTVYVHVVDTVKSYVPKIIREIKHDSMQVIINAGHIPEEIPGDKIYLPNYVHVDTTLKDYYTKRIYQDTARTQYGDIVLFDTVSQNRIIGRQWRSDFAIPFITTETKVPARRQVILMAGLSLVGSKTDILYGAGPNFQLITPGGKGYQVDVLFNKTGNTFYQFKMGFPIAKFFIKNK